MTIVILQELQTRTVDADLFNGLIFIVTTLITVILGVIAWYQRDSANNQKELVKQVTNMSTDVAVMKSNGQVMKENLEDIKEDVDSIKETINSHEKRITKLEAIR